MENLNIKDATAVIITTQNEYYTNLITNNILEINPNLNIIVLTDSDLEKEFYKEHNIYAIDKSKELADRLIEFALKCEIKGNK